jgi:uncharacterized protein YbgA (DUF1722 family)
MKSTNDANLLLKNKLKQAWFIYLENNLRNGVELNDKNLKDIIKSINIYPEQTAELLINYKKTLEIDEAKTKYQTIFVGVLAKNITYLDDILCVIEGLFSFKDKNTNKNIESALDIKRSFVSTMFVGALNKNPGLLSEAVSWLNLTKSDLEFNDKLTCYKPLILSGMGIFLKKNYDLDNKILGEIKALYLNDNIDGLLNRIRKLLPDKKEQASNILDKIINNPHLNTDIINIVIRLEEFKSIEKDTTRINNQNILLSENKARFLKINLFANFENNLTNRTELDNINLKDLATLVRFYPEKTIELLIAHKRTLETDEAKAQYQTIFVDILTKDLTCFNSIMRLINVLLIDSQLTINEYKNKVDTIKLGMVDFVKMICIKTINSDSQKSKNLLGTINGWLITQHDNTKAFFKPMFLSVIFTNLKQGIALGVMLKKNGEPSNSDELKVEIKDEIKDELKALLKVLFCNVNSHILFDFLANSNNNIQKNATLNKIIENSHLDHWAIDKIVLLSRIEYDLQKKPKTSYGDWIKIKKIGDGFYEKAKELLKTYKPHLELDKYFQLLELEYNIKNKAEIKNKNINNLTKSIELYPKETKELFRNNAGALEKNEIKIKYQTIFVDILAKEASYLDSVIMVISGIDFVSKKEDDIKSTENRLDFVKTICIELINRNPDKNRDLFNAITEWSDLQTNNAKNIYKSTFIAVLDKMLGSSISQELTKDISEYKNSTINNLYKISFNDINIAIYNQSNNINTRTEAAYLLQTPSTKPGNGLGSNQLSLRGKGRE